MGELIEGRIYAIVGPFYRIKSTDTGNVVDLMVEKNTDGQFQATSPENPGGVGLGESPMDAARDYIIYTKFK
jgi:hypothetical protein